MPDWDEAAAFLADPATHGAEPVVIETHTARVVLAGDRVWKLRRPVDYGWLDYSSRSRRRIMAEREIAWNGPTAPGLYLGLGGVGAGPCLIGPDATVPEEAEPLVVMQRFDQDRLFDRMAEAGALTPALMQETGLIVARMHKGDPPEAGSMRLPAMARDETRDLRALTKALGAAPVEALTEALGARAAALAPLAAARSVRRCHGDLHLSNIVLWQGVPAPFDCIEFNAEFSQIDPLYDLAFLLMDLDHRGAPGLGPPVLNAWAEQLAAEPGAEVETAYGGLALLALFKAFRAAIRAKINALAAAELTGRERETELAEAAAYLALAKGYLAAPAAPRLIAIGGLSGTGKSTLAQGLAGATGAVVLRSDAVRKGLFAAEETEPLPSAFYRASVTARVYTAMRARARMALAGGQVVILDATHREAEERVAAAEAAAEAGVAFDGLWLEAPVELLAERVETRSGDVSDADARVMAKQAEAETGPIDWTRIDASGTPEAVLARARAALGLE